MREVPVEVRSHPRKHINMCASKGPRLCVIIINRGGVGESAVKDHLFRPWQSSKNMCTPTKIKSILVMKGRLSERLQLCRKNENWFGLRHFADAPFVAPQFVPSLLARLALPRLIYAEERPHRLCAPRRTVIGAICHFSALINSQGLPPLDHRGHRVL